MYDIDKLDEVFLAKQNLHKVMLWSLKQEIFSSNVKKVKMKRLPRWITKSTRS
jgi:hypothetical protein